jgi:Gpi18-like mannosyltransferase
MACWTSWAGDSAGKGLFQFYTATAFCDYPPGYIYILHIVGTIGNLLGIQAGSAAYELLLKTPSILADLAMSYILYRLCIQKLKPTMGLIIAFLYAVNPLVILDSAAWGQIDSILMLAVAGYLIALYRKNIIWASLLFTIGLLIKPQMLLFGPVLAVVFIKYISERGWGQAIKVFFISIVSSLALFAAAVFPFTGDMPWYWVFEKYVGTIGSYNFITLNSANIYGMFGLNWEPISTVKLGLSLGTWGIIGLGLAVALYFVLSFINRNNKNIFMLTAMLITGIYTLGLKMHERYIFPVIAILLIAYIYDNKKSILVKFSIMSTAVFINVAQVLALIHIPKNNLIFIICSGLIVVSYIWITVFCFRYAIISYRDSKVDLMKASDESMGFSEPQ